MKPTKVNILGKEYTITYVEKPSDVDIYQKESLWGQIDFWTGTIRIYDKNRSDEDILHSLLHEIIHGIVAALKITIIQKADDEEDVVDLLALALADILTRNEWIK